MTKLFTLLYVKVYCVHKNKVFNRNEGIWCHSYREFKRCLALSKIIFLSDRNYIVYYDYLYKILLLRVVATFLCYSIIHFMYRNIKIGDPKNML